MRKHARVSPAMVVALIALFVALGGTTYAAVKLPRNSVTTIQVKDRSLLRRDFKSGELRPNVVIRAGFGAIAPGGGRGVVEGSCLAGETLTGGGYSYSGSLEDLHSAPAGALGSRPTTWQVQARNLGSAPAQVNVFALCASP